MEQSLEKVSELYEFLQGNAPDTVTINHAKQPKLSQRQAFAVIWFLQEHMRILPSNIERCISCSTLYDTHTEGTDNHCDFCRK